MRKFVSLLFVAAALGGGWQFLKNYRIEGLEQLSFSPRDGATTEQEAGVVLPPVARQAGTIRIASFNIQVFGEKKLGKPRVRSLLAEIIRQFDIVAIQEIRSQHEILPQFIDTVNAGERHYDFVVGPRLGRTSSKEQYAFIFDTASIEVDRNALYTVADPDDLLHREPLVGWFRVRGPPADQALSYFT